MYFFSFRFRPEMRLPSLLLGGCMALSTLATARPNPPTPRPSALISVGNLLFKDLNRNGVYDGVEPGVANMPVRLVQNGIVRGQTTSDANGNYLFDDSNVPGGVKANTAYEVRILAADFMPTLELTTPQPGVANGSAATLVGNMAVIPLTTGAAGSISNTNNAGFLAGNADLLLTKTTNSGQVSRGSAVVFTLQASNIGGSTASGIVIRDTLDAGIGYTSANPVPASSTTLGTGQVVLVWNLSNLLPNASTTLTINSVANADGISYNTAWISTTDQETNLGNNASRACFTVPVKLCVGERYVANLDAAFFNVQWYRNGTALPPAVGGNTNSLTITQSGSYSFTSTTNVDCPAGGCCPLVIYDGTLQTLAITPASSAICAGRTTTLTASGCTVGTLAWSNGLGSASSVSVSPTVNTVYSVTCTPAASSSFCPSSTTALVSINPSVTATLSSATVCNGLNTQLLATGGTSYTLANAGGIVASNTSGTFPLTGTVNGVTTYTVTVTNANGCVGTAQGTLTVNPSVTATLSSATVCNGLTTQLLATGGTSYTLSNSSGMVANNTSGTFPLTGTVNGVTTYTVTVANATGCVGTATGMLTVNPTPVLVVTPGLNPVLCQNQTVVLAVSGCEAGVLVWSTGDSGVNSLTVTPLATTVYSATCTQGTAPNQCVASTTITVTVNLAPTALPTSVTVTPGSCIGSVAQPNAKISLRNLLNTTRVDVSAGNSYTGSGANSPTSQAVSGGAAAFSGLPGSANVQTFTLRLFGNNGCTTDLTVLIGPSNCECPAPKCAPVKLVKAG